MLTSRLCFFWVEMVYCSNGHIKDGNLWISILSVTKTVLWTPATHYQNKELLPGWCRDLTVVVLCNFMAQKDPLHSCLDPPKGLCFSFFREESENLQVVSYARLPKIHSANIVGNLPHSDRCQGLLWLFLTTVQLQEVADAQDFLWKVFWKLLTWSGNEVKRFLPI